jgi:hypothetical protein
LTLWHATIAALLATFGEFREGPGTLATMRERLLDTAVTVGLLLVVVLPFAAVVWLISRLV